MFNDLIKSMLPRVLQDFLVTAAGILVAHGYISSSQTEGFVGSTFFLGMLAVNYFVMKSRKADAVTTGAAAIVAVLPTTDEKYKALANSSLNMKQSNAVVAKLNTPEGT